MKRLLFLLICLINVMSFSTCLDDRAEKSDIISFVKENEKQLVECINKNDFNMIKENKIIQDIDADEDLVEFSCGGAGFGSATSYSGFYYSANDDMTEIWCAPSDNEQLQISGEGYEWHEEDGDNCYYTEKSQVTSITTKHHFSSKYLMKAGKC